MKTIILFLLISTSCFSQDSSLIKTSLPIQPIVATGNGDTAHYMHWTAFNINRTKKTMLLVVELLDKSGKVLYMSNLEVDASVIGQWAFDPKPIDDFILSKNPRLKRK